MWGCEWFQTSSYFRLRWVELHPYLFIVKNKRRLCQFVALNDSACLPSISLIVFHHVAEQCVCVCVCACKFILYVSLLLFPLCCTCHTADYLPISFVCKPDTHFIPLHSVYDFLLFDTPIHSPSFFFTPLHIIFSNSVNPFFCPAYNFCLTYLTLSFSWFFCLCVVSHPLSLKMCFWGLERQLGCTHIIRKFKSHTEDCICITIIWITVQVIVFTAILYACFSVSCILHIFVYIIFHCYKVSCLPSSCFIQNLSAWT